ncbi:hypothetical protein SDC9_54076 [bioreactor metagenome]|uniref:GyrI-like small molecule binding domain-containing protein n=1 Tax=bioreactor metagenome TaxID=1076179 RepID=A0A644WWA4_9ZZZZ
MDLPSCKYMIFHGEPFKDEDFGEAIDTVWEAIKKFSPKLYGYEWATEDGPRFQLAPIGERGYIEGIPVRALQ